MLAYRHLRNLHLATRNREYWKLRQARKRVYGQYLGRNQLAFDIGACHGEITEVFASLGCRVVAVEPTPGQAALVQKRYGNSRVRVETVAVGDTPGDATFTIGQDPGHSTLNTEWVNTAGDRWAGQITVPVVTLADLEARYGHPAFIKIDVEGYEPNVLRGADRLPPALCFEFQNAAPDIAEEAIGLLDGYQFTHTLGESPYPATGWTSSTGILQALRVLAHVDPTGYGDVFATTQPR